MADNVTIELTKKTLKAQLVISVVIFMIGGILVLATDLTTVGLVLSLAGGFGAIVTKIRIWWNHE